MSDLMGLIYTGDSGERLESLTSLRAVAALPVGARYRVIDFVLSSLVSSGARNVGVIMQKNYHSLIDHLGSGKEWDLHGKRQGLVILPPFQTPDNIGVYAGLLDAIRSNLLFLRRSRERYVVVTDSSILYTADFDEMLSQHIRSGADITLMYTRNHSVLRPGLGHYIKLDNDGRVLDLENDPMVPSYDNTYMDCFLIRRELLIELADRAVSRGQYHFTRELLQQAVTSGSLKLYGYENAYPVWRMDSVQAYFDCNMALLDPEIRRQTLRKDRPVWTKMRDEMPTRFAAEAVVKNSLLADGCVIEGTVENSILFRGVHVMKGAVVRNAVIMQDGYIMPNAHVEGFILDKQVTIRDGQNFCAPMSYPVVIAKGTTV
ncbi:MAG: glucose-1-phosphate adenylyltransferase subunit GlgD [Clostridia bacterium]|nr:glucose-1-phosphate adenylyltransferase subunit GlgD [Clostridia bacterium]